MIPNTSLPSVVKAFSLINNLLGPIKKNNKMNFALGSFNLKILNYLRNFHHWSIKLDRLNKEANFILSLNSLLVVQRLFGIK